MKKLFTFFALSVLLFSCKKDEVDPDGLPKYSDIVTSDGYEFITATQWFYSGNYVGIPNIAPPSGSNWSSLKRYNNLISKDYGEPNIGITQIFFRVVPGSTALVITDSNLIVLPCGDSSSLPKISNCINNEVVSSYLNKQYYPQANRVIYWKKN